MPGAPNYKQLIANLCFLRNPLQNQHWAIIATEREVSAVLYQVDASGKHEYMAILYTAQVEEGAPWLGDDSHEGRMKVALGQLQKQIDQAVQSRLDKVRASMKNNTDNWARVSEL